MAWVTTVARVPSLALELPHAKGMAKKKKKKKKSKKQYIFIVEGRNFWKYPLAKSPSSVAPVSGDPVP